MPRSARKYNQNQTYNIMLRGNDRQNLFIDEDDKNKIIQTVAEKKETVLFIYMHTV